MLDNPRALKIEAKPPKFDDTRNPNEFLGRLEKYYNIKSITDNGSLNVLDNALEERLKACFETQRSTLLNFDDFKDKSLAESYSVRIRVKTKSAGLKAV